MVLFMSQLALTKQEDFIMSETLPLSALDDNNQETETQLPELKVKRRKLPSGIASNVKQHIVLVRDHSTSMSGHKIAELNQASESLVMELAEPLNKDGFRISVVDFNNVASRLFLGEPAESLSVPPAVSSGGTNFIDAMNETLVTIREFDNQPNDEGWHFLRPVILFLSDGQASVDDTLIYELQEEAEVISIAYGADADQSTLARIASNGEVEVIGTDGGALRTFLADVGKTLSQAIQRN